MKAITIKPLWAVLIRLHLKQFETRTWAPSYRGPIAIHASARISQLEKELFYTDPFYAAFKEHGITRHAQLEQFCSKVVATGELVAVYKTDLLEVDSVERAFGDFSEGRYAWRLEKVRWLSEPIPAKGALGIWNWDTMGGVQVG